MEGKPFIRMGVVWMLLGLVLWLTRVASEVPWLAPAFGALGVAFVLVGFRWTVEDQRNRRD